MNDSKATEAMLEQGFAQLQTGQFEDAIDTFTACHLVEASDDRAFRGRGLAYVQLGKAAAAEAEFTAARRLNDKEPENWMGLAVSFALQNKVYEAIATYEELIAMLPAHVAAHIQLGRLQIKIGAIDRGRDWLKRALELRPTLEQRRLVESILKEEAKLDTNRYYRPDFDRLRRSNAGLGSFLQGILSRFKKKDEVGGVAK